MAGVNTHHIKAFNTFRHVTTIHDIIARRLAAARDAMKMSRETASARLGEGFSVSAIQAHENGRNKLSAEAARRYARLYRTPLDWLLAIDVPTRSDGMTVVERGPGAVGGAPQDDDADLIEALIEESLRDRIKADPERTALGRAVARAYIHARQQRVSPDNRREIQLILEPLLHAPHDTALRPKSA